MPGLLPQADVRPAQQLRFCYLCGQLFADPRDNRPDQVPCSAIFAKEDRIFPLKVSSHLDCNRGLSSYDEVIGQLIAVIHGKHTSANKNKLKAVVLKNSESDQVILGFKDTGLVAHIGRWVRGFHAALYHQFLPDEGTRWAVHPPFPLGQLEGDDLKINEVLNQQALFVLIIKKNRA